MKYSPQIHHRRSIRLKGYDYSQAGLYFITICSQDRECRFGKIENDEMILNEYGIIAYNEWKELPKRFINFELDVFQIMPNHMHGIILLNNVVGATLAVAQEGFDDDNITQPKRQPQGIVQNDLNNNITQPKGQPQGIAPTIGDIVGAYKSLVANGCLEIYKMKNQTMGKLWQRNYHEHIIRNEQSYQNISEYIIRNPAKWNNDTFFK